jgi:hypothetical protein
MAVHQGAHTGTEAVVEVASHGVESHVTAPVVSVATTALSAGELGAEGISAELHHKQKLSKADEEAGCAAYH